MSILLLVPQDLGVKIPANLRAPRLRAGFEHAKRGGYLADPEYFRLSFHMGFRAAKLCRPEIRRRQGIREFPRRVRIRLRAIW
ncbi:MAG: hypothetical protein AMJ84_02800 [Acidithiobacillales bacterium SM23_46]|jgi:hypothetical protein|nr:MAG: hypothetical protein AMJ84_02800 [Acidithiobacillales bacterium SM23_46]